MKQNKRYRISRSLDSEVDYYTTKIKNERYFAIEINDFDYVEFADIMLEKLSKVEQDMMINENGIFTVSSDNFILAIECRNAYRQIH